MLLRLWITTLWLVILAGCATSFKGATDYRLCYSYAKYPSYNIHTESREAEIRRRGLNCSVYSDRIDEEMSRIELEAAGATQINNRTTIYQPIKREEQDICGINKYGVYVYCN